MLTSSPIPGVSIDVNDLGVVGGVALVLLTSILVFCVMREHENLYLALYKVRRLCDVPDQDHTHGESAANLLYHRLVMGQVLSSPPTLAQWKHRGILHHVSWVFFLPLVT